MFLDKIISQGMHLARLATNLHVSVHCCLQHTSVDTSSTESHTKTKEIWEEGYARSKDRAHSLGHSALDWRASFVAVAQIYWCEGLQCKRCDHDLNYVLDGRRIQDVESRQLRFSQVRNADLEYKLCDRDAILQIKQTRKLTLAGRFFGWGLYVCIP